MPRNNQKKIRAQINDSFKIAESISKNIEDVYSKISQLEQMGDFDIVNDLIGKYTEEVRKLGQGAKEVSHVYESGKDLVHQTELLKTNDELINEIYGTLEELHQQFEVVDSIQPGIKEHIEDVDSMISQLEKLGNLPEVNGLIDKYTEEKGKLEEQAKEVLQIYESGGDLVHQMELLNKNIDSINEIDSTLHVLKRQFKTLKNRQREAPSKPKENNNAGNSPTSVVGATFHFADEIAGAQEGENCTNDESNENNGPEVSR
ncbi:MAG: hypothetical protein CMF46_01840 [Legionellales bacterium]|nr:hypothetical protein [Legionellales bacterium]